MHQHVVSMTVANRPRTAVRTGTGLAGLGGLVAWVAFAHVRGLDGPYAALVNLAACALPMVLWALLVERVYRNATTGIDWTRKRPWRETLDISLTKLIGFWLTWALIALVYAVERVYWHGPFAFSMWCLGWAALPLVLLSVPYVLWLDRRLVEPRDGAWHLGAWLTNQPGTHREAIYDHLRCWAIKGFFLAYMLAGLPGGFGAFVRADVAAAIRDPVLLAQWLITLMFLVDMAFATVGYILTFRPLDAHIRSANPFAGAWVAALICYPPFMLMTPGGPLDYRPGTRDWIWWTQGHPALVVLIGAMLVLLTAIYAWSTVAFGPRFSNLTNRGILTGGPYSWSRHPAYLSKNLFWWVSTIPVLTTGSLVDAARSTLLLGAISGVYWWRAKTEEAHLKLDPRYVAYDAWIGEYGVVPRCVSWVTASRSSPQHRHG